MFLSRKLASCFIFVAACASEGNGASRQQAVETTECSRIDKELNAFARTCASDNDCAVVHDEYAKNLYCAIALSSSEVPNYHSLRQSWVELGCATNATVSCAERVPTVRCNAEICILD